MVSVGICSTLRCPVWIRPDPESGSRLSGTATATGTGVGTGTDSWLVGASGEDALVSAASPSLSPREDAWDMMVGNSASASASQASAEVATTEVGKGNGASPADSDTMVIGLLVALLVITATIRHARIQRAHE